MRHAPGTRSTKGTLGLDSYHVTLLVKFEPLEDYLGYSQFNECLEKTIRCLMHGNNR